MGLQSKHLLFAVVLGVFVGCTGLIRFRAPVILVPLALSGLYVAALTAGRGGNVATGIARGSVIGGLILISATALLAGAAVISILLSRSGLVVPSRDAFDTVWIIGGLMMMFWLLVGIVGNVFGRR